MDPEHCIFIPGFGLAGYRSFGPEMQRIGLCKKINLIAGQNNSGKSNVLRFVQSRYKEWLESINANNRPAYKDLEVYRSSRTIELQASLLLRFGQEEMERLTADQTFRQNNVVGLISGVLAVEGFKPAGENLWWLDLVYNFNEHQSLFPPQLIGAVASPGRFAQTLYNVSLNILGGASSNTGENAIKFLRWMTKQLLPASPKCITIPGIRLILPRF